MVARSFEANGRPVCSVTGQRVHVGADQEHGPRTVPENRDHSGLADMFGHLEAELAHLRRELGGRASLLHRQLGVGMEVAIERHQLRHVAPDRFGQGGRIGGHGQAHYRGGEQQCLDQRIPPGNGVSSMTSSREFEVRSRHDEPPAHGADPLDIAGDVAVLVGAILHRPALARQHQRPEEDLLDRVGGEDQPKLALHAAQHHEALQPAVRAHSAGEGPAHGKGKIAGALRADPDQPAPVEAICERAAGNRRIGLQERAFAVDFGPVTRGARGGHGSDEVLAPVAQALLVVLGGDLPPVVAAVREHAGRPPDGRAPGKREEAEQDRSGAHLRGA